MNAPAKKTYTIEDYASIISGESPLPNFEPVSAKQFANALAASGHSMVPKWGWSKSDYGHKTWAFYFLTNYSNMGGDPDGSGYVCVYGMNGPKTGRFAICKHQKRLDGDAIPSRGWNPGRCVKCGLDMTIDSGD